VRRFKLACLLAPGRPEDLKKMTNFSKSSPIFQKVAQKVNFSKVAQKVIFLKSSPKSRQAKKRPKYLQQSSI
jgi:hypothetical protein